MPKLPKPTFLLVLGAHYLTKDIANKYQPLLKNFRVGVTGCIEESEQFLHKLLFSPVGSKIILQFFLLLKVQDEVLPLALFLPFFLIDVAFKFVDAFKIFNFLSW